MFSFLDYSGLQHYWWALVSLLGALLVFLLFVQGGQSLIYSLASNEKEKTILLNSTGRKWEITFTTLVTFEEPFSLRFRCFILPVLAVHIGFGWRFYLHLSSKQFPMSSGAKPIIF